MISERRIRKEYKTLAPVYHAMGLNIAGDVQAIRRLSTIEKTLHKYAEDFCSIDLSEVQIRHRERKTESMLNEVRAMLPLVAAFIFVNGDPRGWSLKIDDAAMRKFYEASPDNPINRLARDWGGYGLIAPDAQLN